jgi:hypothetical protein
VRARTRRDEPARQRAVTRLGEEYRFGIVLLLLLATFALLASGPKAAWTRPLTVTLQGCTLIAALAAARVGERVQRLGGVFVVVCIAVSFAAAFTDGDVGRALTAILSGVLVGVAPFVIGHSIVRRHVIDTRTVLAALCIYVLLGLLWAFVFSAIGDLSGDPFFAQHADATSSEYVYFSFITLTTVGYGDLSAAGNVGRSCAVLEALIGQIYLVTVVALLVSNLGRGIGAQATAGAPGESPDPYDHSTPAPPPRYEEVTTGGARATPAEERS